MGVSAIRPIFLMGPTASGKTEVATRLYEVMDCELVSVDSAQVFRGMDIGTAKPDHEFLQKYPHHLIDIRDVDSSYSAAEFRADSLELIDSITARSRVPVFVGGTMFYFSALEKGLSALPSSDPKTRKGIEREMFIKGNQALYAELEEIDPVSAKRVRPGDTQRLQRLFEIYRLTGESPSKVMAKSRLHGIGSNCIKIALACGDRKQLHGRIASRFTEMLDRGLVDEVEALVRGLYEPEALASMRCVGYRQVLRYLQGHTSLENMKNMGIAATRKLAKRQLTWLRNQSNLTWFDSDSPAALDSIPAYLESLPDMNLYSRDAQSS